MNKDKIKRDMNKDKIKREGIKMRKTTESIYNKNSLTVDTVGLQGILGSGRRTAVDIGMAAGYSWPPGFMECIKDPEIFG